MTTHLPVINPSSTAASTAFVTARLDGPDGRHLWLDGNGKITAGNGTLEAPAPNAFSLPQIASCPGSTEVCRKACYVHNLEAAQAELHAKYVENFETMKHLLGPGRTVLRDTWAWHVGDWISANARGGFRWHVSGDVFSLAYARWIQLAVIRSPQVNHWIYTRSFAVDGVTEPLFGLANLEVNLSADADNYSLAKVFAERAEITHGKRPRITYLTVNGEVPDDLPHGSIIFPDYGLRTRGMPSVEASAWWDGLAPRMKQMVCPVDAHGKSEKRRCGPCDRCLR